MITARTHPRLLGLHGTLALDGAPLIDGHPWDSARAAARVQAAAGPGAALSYFDGDESRKVQALDAGADDYLTKPFGMEELLARVRVLLRRAAAAGAAPGEPVVVAGELCIDLASHLVHRAGQEVPLTRTEFALLRELARNAGKLLPHRHLLQHVWGPEYGDEPEYLRTFMAQLRKKLEPNPAHPRHLLTQPGIGYRFSPG